MISGRSMLFPRLASLSLVMAILINIWSNSVRKFPDQETFAAMISKAGFEKVSFRNYTGGVAALHSGWKI